MSRLVDRAIASAGLQRVLAARRQGTLGGAEMASLREAELLALGALADLVRAQEVGDDVRIYTSDDPGAAHDVTSLPRDGSGATGIELLREVAIARIAGPPGARVRVDWTRCGLELAQVALGFGANELAGRVASKRGLPLADGDVLGVGKKSRLESAQIVKHNELAAFVRRAGRTPSFVDAA